MSFQAVNAAQAYASAAGRTLQTTAPETTTSSTGASSFTQILKEVVSDSITAANRAEQAGVSAAAGQTDLIGVVTAVSQAEVAVQTVVTIRDKVVQAYQDILKMPI